MLGGSSGINYLMYVRGSRKDYDGWRDLGNEGWGWNDLVPYFRKHQILDLPTDKVKGVDPQLMPHAAADKYHGTNGTFFLSRVRTVNLMMRPRSYPYKLQ
jgi:choline dehydrogenase-like flavoprotein